MAERVLIYGPPLVRMNIEQNAALSVGLIGKGIRAPLTPDMHMAEAPPRL